MATVTVGGASGQTVTLNFDSTANAAIASRLAAAITSGVNNGTIIPAVDTNGPPPALPPGKTGEFIQTLDGTTVLPRGYSAFIDTAANAVVFGSGDKDQSVLASSGTLDFTSTGGSGTVVGGGGSSRIVIPATDPPTDKGNWSINTGNGNDQILALGAGSDTINAGGGNNQIQLGTGKDFIQSTGNDLIFASSGQETVTALGSATDFIQGNASQLYFVGNSGSATIFGGTGSDTFFGGSGPDYVQGGTGGKNLLVGGSGAATLIGGGSGDQLMAGISPGQLLEAGSGNETLLGGFGSDTFVGGGSNSSTEIFGGRGNDTFVSAGGTATVTAGAASNLFVFVSSNPGGTEQVNGFIKGLDQIGLQDFGPGEVRSALNSQQVINGSDTITLSDNTTVTFVGVTSLSQSDFVTINSKNLFTPHQS